MDSRGQQRRWGRWTDRGFKCVDAVRAGEAHGGEDGDALLWRRVVQGGRTHGAVAGGGAGVQHGGQSEGLSKV